MPRGRRRCERAWAGLHSVGGSDWGERSVEIELVGAGPFELEEPRRARHQHPTIPKPAGYLTLGRGRDHGTEERGPSHGDHGRAHLVTDQGDGTPVTGTQNIVNLTRGGEPQKVRGQADLLQRRGDNLAAV